MKMYFLSNQKGSKQNGIEIVIKGTTYALYLRNIIYTTSTSHSTSVEVERERLLKLKENDYLCILIIIYVKREQYAFI